VATKKNYQEVYINLDDSGKLSSKELISVYGGIVFFSKKEKDKFITQYRSILKDIKCGYCNKECCNKKCPEIKNINIKSEDKRRIMNYMKKYYVVTSIIRNNQIFKHIINDKASKGRYIDYTIKLLIKNILIEIIKKKIINPNKPVRLIINIDEQSTKSNGYYNLSAGLYEELLHGIKNFDYQINFSPILFSQLEIKLAYQNSSNSYVVQAADLLAGTIRRICIYNKDDNINMNNELERFVNFKITFP